MKRWALIVDDDPAMIVMLTTLLQAHRYNVIAAENAATALSLVQVPEYSFSLLVTDFQMPGRTGVELIREVLKLKVPPPPIILLTGMDLDIAPIQELRAEVEGGHDVSFASKNTAIRALAKVIGELANKSERSAP